MKYRYTGLLRDATINKSYDTICSQMFASSEGAVVGDAVYFPKFPK